MPGKKKEGTAGGVSGGGSFLWTRRGAWCLVCGKEDRRSWGGSLVSGERRRLMSRYTWDLESGGLLNFWND